MAMDSWTGVTLLLEVFSKRRNQRRFLLLCGLVYVTAVGWQSFSLPHTTLPLCLPVRGPPPGRVAIVPANAPLPESKESLRILSYNVLLPNSEDGWWTYKYYLPEVPSQAYTWEARKALLRKAIADSDADIVCVQEASGRSPFEEDFDFMFQSGYQGTLLAKGRMRCATFWRPEVAELALEPLSKDRTLITPFHLSLEGTKHELVWVINAHLTAGPQPGRRLRQTHEALETVRKQRKKMNADDGLPPAVVFCGDLNADDELEGLTAVHTLLTSGSVQKSFVDSHYVELGPVSSKNRKQACGRFVDAYAAAFPEGAAPPTLVAPELIDRFFASDRASLTPELEKALGALFDRYAAPSPSGELLMDQESVDRWLVDVNRNATRGSEFRAALAAFERNAGPFLRRGDLEEVYRKELSDGKFWGVAHDLWATGTHHGCLPEPGEAGSELEVFKARFDHIYFTESTLELLAVREPSAPGADRPLPNECAPSDHLPIGATLRLRQTG